MNGLEQLAVVNFADVWHALPSDEAHIKRYKDAGLECLFLETVETAARRVDISPSAALGFALSPKGNWRIQRDFAAYVARYVASEAFEAEVRAFQQNPASACVTAGIYEELLHTTYEIILRMIAQLRQPVYRANVIADYHTARGKAVFNETEAETYRRVAETLPPEMLRL